MAYECPVRVLMATPQEVQALRDEINRLSTQAAQPQPSDPAELLKQEYSAAGFKLSGLTPSEYHTTYTLEDPGELLHYARNPVPRPPGIIGAEFSGLI